MSMEKIVKFGLSRFGYMIETNDELSDYIRRKFGRNIGDAFAKVERADFVPKTLEKDAYIDCAQSLGYRGATISQPSTIAFMLKNLDLRDGQRIAELGSGCGYVIDIIDNMVDGSEIFGFEIVPQLIKESAKRFGNRENIHIIGGNCFEKIKDYSPFDRILVSATCSAMEDAEGFAKYLKKDGIIVVPVSFEEDSISCRMYRIRKKDKKIKKSKLAPWTYSFVPLVNPVK